VVNQTFSFQSHRVRSGDFKKGDRTQDVTIVIKKFQSHRVRSGDFKKACYDIGGLMGPVSISSSEKWGF